MVRGCCIDKSKRHATVDYALLHGNKTISLFPDDGALYHGTELHISPTETANTYTIAVSFLKVVNDRSLDGPV